MKVSTAGMFADNPAFRLLPYLNSYEGTTTGDGAATGLTLLDSALTLEPSYAGLAVKVLTGNAAGALKPISTIVAGVVTVSSAFTDSTGAAIQIVSGTRYVILSMDTSLAISILAALGVPTIDSAANIYERDVIGNKSDTLRTSVGTTYSDTAYLKGLITLLNNQFEPTLPDLVEAWQNETGIPEAYWEWTNPATGTPWARGASAAWLRAYSVPNASENCRLNGRHQWQVGPGTFGANTIVKKLCMEFSIRMTNVANMTTAATFWGFTTAKTDTRASNNLVGFAITGGALQTVTDNGGVETTNTGFGETLTNVNKLRIEIYNGHVKFYLNEVQIADQTTNLPDQCMYPNFYVATGAGGTATQEIGMTRIWYENILR